MGWRWAVVAAGLVSLVGLTAARLPDWREDRRLWTAAVQHAPLLPRAWINLGTAYSRTGADAPAAHCFRLAAALAGAPGRSQYEQTIGRATADLNAALTRWNQGDGRTARAWVAELVTRRPTLEWAARWHTWLITHPDAQPPASSSLPF